MAWATVARTAEPTRQWAGSWLLLAAITMIAFAILGVLSGPVMLTLEQMASAVFEVLSGRPSSDRGASAILLHIRLPRVLLGAAVGAGLAVAGCALQGVFRNPLADPGLIGVSAGAAVGAVSIIVLGEWLFGVKEEAELFDTFRPYLLPMAAFGGAVFVTLLIFQLVREHEGRGLSVATLLLAGVAVNAIAGAVIGGLTYISDDQQLRDLTFWSMGNLGGADWTSTLLASACVVLALMGVLRMARSLDLFQIGERAAFHSGVDVEQVKWRVGGLSALAVGAGTAVAGPVGFIGLVAPHLARLLAGPGHRVILPLSALIGASLVLAADLFVRLVVPPAEPPIGLATSLIGGPFFLWLLLQRTRGGAGA